VSCADFPANADSVVPSKRLAQSKAKSVFLLLEGMNSLKASLL
jgi:hypothetical protein